MDSPESTQQETESLSTEDLLSKTFDEMEAAEEVETDEEVEISAEEDSQGDEENAGEETDPEVEEETETVEAEAELTEEIEEAAESEYNEPAPERWPEEIRKVYNELPPAARQAMLEGIYKPMQKSYTQTTQQLAQQRNELAPFVQILEENRSAFENTGVDPVEVVKTQVAWAAHFQRVGAEQGMSDMRQAYGLDNQQAGQEGSKYLTPTERGFKQQIDALSKQVQGQQQQSQDNRQEQVVNAQKAEINNTLQNFVNEKTEDGKPMHPHVDKVASNIAGIIKGGLVAKADEWGNPVPMRDQLAQAYSMACNLDPSIRTPAIDNRQAGRVKAAQKVSVVTKNPASQQEVDDLPMSGFIEKTYDQLAGR